MPSSRPLDTVKPHHPSATLIDRNQARLILGCSYSTILNYERRGDLAPIRLSKLAKAKVFFRLDEVRAKAGMPPSGEQMPSPVNSKHQPKGQHPATIVVDGRTYALVQ